MKKLILRSVIAVTAVVGLATPAFAAVDLAIKRAIVEVVLENLGVTASDAFVTEIAQGIDATELDQGLLTTVSNMLDTNADPRSVIESQTDANGDGVPDEGAALDDDDDDDSPNPNSTEKSGNSTDKSGNSSNRNPNGTSNNSGGNNSGDDESTDETDDSGDDGSDDESDEDEEDESDEEESDD